MIFERVYSALKVLAPAMAKRRLGGFSMIITGRCDHCTVRQMHCGGRLTRFVALLLFNTPLWRILVMCCVRLRGKARIHTQGREKNMDAGKLETIATGFGILEGPVWHPEFGLLAADVIHGGVWAFGPTKDPEVVVPHRKGIGGMALHANGGLIISGRNLAIKQLGDAGAPTIVLVNNDPDHGVVGFNDLTVDMHGRIYVGSLGFVATRDAVKQKPGQLYLVDVDGRTTVVAEDVKLTNGLALSSDRKYLYHADSLRHIVIVYDVRDDGSLGVGRRFIDTGSGHPDGMAVDEGGMLWVALAGEARVAAYDSRGREVASIRVPVPMAASVCFGGDDMRDLYIVTGSEGLNSDRGGGVYKLRVEVPGIPRPLARVSASQSQ